MEDVDEKQRVKKWIWKGEPNTEEKHKHDYRWIKDKKEREKWIREHWIVPENSLSQNSEVKE